MSVTVSARPEPASRAVEIPLGLAEQLLVFRRRWRVVFAMTCLVTLVALAAVLLAKPAYTATGILLYDPAGAATPGDPLAPLVDQENEDAATASQVAVIASLPAAASLAGQLDLAADPAFKATAGDLGGLALAVQRALDVTMLPNSRIIAVSFTCANPARAAAAANLAMRLYLDHQRQESFSALTDSQNWLEKNSATVQTALDATEAQLAKARADAGVVQGDQGSLTAETVSQIAASLVQAQAQLAMDQARLSSAARGDAAAANAAIAPNLLPLRKEQADLTAQVRSLSGQYGADYPELVAARAALAAISGEIRDETGRELAAAQADVAAGQAEVATLKSALAAARSQSQTEDTESAPVRALEQRADAGRAMLRNMTLQADQLAQEASLIRPDARILSAATAPARRNGPGRSLVLAVACLLGFCLGLLLAVLLEALDTSFRSGGALAAAAGLPCLALLPEVADPLATPLLMPFSLFSEQLRSLQTGLMLGALHPGGRMLAITAARPDEGKTTLTIALGRALASAGMRVLAIDGDIRQPGFDHVFGLNGAAGLTDHLAGLAARSEIIHPDPLSPLAVIGAGTQARAALPLFLSPAMPACLAALRGEYDVILLDVPPAFALAEGRVLARLADYALLCVRWGNTPRRVVTAAITLLQESGVNLAGAALTRVDAAAHGRSGYPDAEIYQPRYGNYFREPAAR